MREHRSRCRLSVLCNRRGDQGHRASDLLSWYHGLINRQIFSNLGALLDLVILKICGYQTPEHSAMITNRTLPADFLRKLKSLEESYLIEKDPIRQSGFGGGPERWRMEREPVLDPVKAGGELLDIGCANGFLLECLIKWGRGRGLEVTPYGLDISAPLIELAKKRFPENVANFYVANAWDWKPPRRFQHVYSLYDCVPPDFLEEYVERLLARVVAPRGQLIIGAYGSLSEETPPYDIAGFLKSRGFTVAGTAQGGAPPITSFAWIDRKRPRQ